MKIQINSQMQYDNLISQGFDWSKVTNVRFDNLPLVTALPELPAATNVMLYNHLRKLRTNTGEV